MDSSKDLDRLDRVTLRTWRTANIVGWWFAGAVVYNVGEILLSRTIVLRVASSMVGWHTLVVDELLGGFIAATAGWLVGRHVYRWPGIVGAAIVLLPGGAFVALAFLFNGFSGYSGPGFVLLLWFAYTALPIASAAAASRIAWGQRPSALRAGKSRNR